MPVDFGEPHFSELTKPGKTSGFGKDFSELTNGGDFLGYQVLFDPLIAIWQWVYRVPKKPNLGKRTT